MLLDGSVIGSSPARSVGETPQGNTRASRGSKRARLGLPAIAALCALLGFAALTAPGALGAGSSAPPARPAPAPAILEVRDVREGMKGWGLSVFRGTTPERFEVEVLGVLPNLAAGRNLVLVRVAGQGLEESGILAGMSGSPVWIDGKLLGAVSSGWQFAKSPIAGVTPIAEMLAVDADPAAPAPARPGGGKSVWARGASPAARIASLLRPVEGEGEEGRAARLRAAFDEALPSLPSAAGSLLSPFAAGLPLSASGDGAAAAALRHVGLPASFPAVAAGGGSGAAAGSPQPAAPSRPIPGASVSALLIDGDMAVGANGTVTWVGEDGRFLAFGHPFLALGDVDLAVAPAAVIASLPSLAQSFKLAAPSGPAAWRLVRDREAGVSGRSDRPGRMVPATVRMTAEGFEPRSFSFRLASHPKLLGPLLAVAIDSATNAGDMSPRDRTLRYRVTVKTSAGPMTVEEAASGMRAREIAILTASTLVSIVSDNDFAEPGIDSIEVELSSSPGEKRLRIVDAALSRRRAAPGDTLHVAVRLRDRRGEETTRVLSLAVPASAPEGKASVVVGDGNAATGVRNTLLSPSDPESLAGLRAWLAALLPPTRLWAGLVVPTRGAAVSGSTLESLPPTAAALLESPAVAGAVRSVDVRLLSEAGADFDRPLSGLVRLELEIERPRS